MTESNSLICCCTGHDIDNILKMLEDLQFTKAKASRINGSISPKCFHKVDFYDRQSQIGDVWHDEFLDFNEACLVLQNVCKLINDNALIVSQKRSFMGIFKDDKLFVVSYNHKDVIKVL